MFDAFDHLNPSSYGTGFVATYTTAKNSMANLAAMRSNVQLYRPASRKWQDTTRRPSLSCWPISNI
jgi:hypothetical protein